MLNIDFLRNSLPQILGVLEGDFWVSKWCPDTLLAKAMTGTWYNNKYQYEMGKIILSKKWSILYHLIFEIFINLALLPGQKWLLGQLCVMDLRYILTKFTKLTVLNLTRLGLCEKGSIIKNIVKYFIIQEISILYCMMNISRCQSLLNLLIAISRIWH